MATPPFRNVLIANRGEIACRIARTCHRLGVQVTAVYSEADAGSLHREMADQSVLIGPPAARESYLNIARVIDAARTSGADAIHPGYGFLSENADFAEACEGAGVTFIGPPSGVIRRMGMKAPAKRIAEAAGVPVTPGANPDAQTDEDLFVAAERTGFPVLIKASAGGGGRGMRLVETPDQFARALAGARREAMSAFSDDTMLVERWIGKARHIEVQIMADRHGGAIHLFERDCSLQRRHQKLVEECAAPGMTAQMREAVTGAAVRLAREIGYVGAGTIEFIADASDGLRPDRFWFMEMNTRLQVEHPVTEAVTGLDLVELQLLAAAGEPLPVRQDDLTLKGHAIEARLCAEDPAKNHLPSPGAITTFVLPEGEGVRVDCGVRAGDAVTPWYDSMIAKVIAHGATRDEARERLAAALDRTRIEGVKTNSAYLAAALRHPAFAAGDVTTGLLQDHAADLVPPKTPQAAN